MYLLASTGLLNHITVVFVLREGFLVQSLLKLFLSFESGEGAIAKAVLCRKSRLFHRGLCPVIAQ